MKKIVLPVNFFLSKTWFLSAQFIVRGHPWKICSWVRLSWGSCASFSLIQVHTRYKLASDYGWRSSEGRISRGTVDRVPSSLKIQILNSTKNLFLFIGAQNSNPPFLLKNIVSSQNAENMKLRRKEKFEFFSTFVKRNTLQVRM